MVCGARASGPLRAERSRAMTRVVGFLVEVTVKVGAAIVCTALLLSALQRAAGRS